jgi:O-antigen ligase
MGLLSATFICNAVRMRATITVLLVVAAVASGVAMVQFVTQYLEFRSTGLITDDPTVLARTTGFMGHWMTFSGEQMLVWCMAIPLAWMFLSRAHWVPLSLVGVGILLSFTRGVWVGAAAGVVMMGFYLPPRLLVRMMIPVGLIGILASGLIFDRIARSFLDEDFVPDSSRLEMLGVGARMVRDHPLFGVGPERVGVEFTDYYEGTNIDVFYYGHLHNNYMQIAAERGLPALAALLWLMGRIGWDLFRFTRSPVAELRWTAVAGLAVLVSFLVAGMFEYNFGDSEMLMLFLFLVSLPYGLAGGGSETGLSPAAD